MDPRWQPHLEHPAAPLPPSLQARELLAEGWRSDGTECWTHGACGQQALIAPDTWRELRELAACVRTRTLLQLR